MQPSQPDLPPPEPRMRTPDEQEVMECVRHLLREVQAGRRPAGWEVYADEAREVLDTWAEEAIVQIPDHLPDPSDDDWGIRDLAEAVENEMLRTPVEEWL